MLTEKIPKTRTRNLDRILCQLKYSIAIDESSMQWLAYIDRKWRIINRVEYYNMQSTHSCRERHYACICLCLLLCICLFIGSTALGRANVGSMIANKYNLMTVTMSWLIWDSIIIICSLIYCNEIFGMLKAQQTLKWLAWARSYHIIFLSSN